MTESEPKDWRIVRQPNDLYARFSNDKRDFTHLNLSEADALRVCTQDYGLSAKSALGRVRRAVEEGLPVDSDQADDAAPPPADSPKHARWNAALAEIREAHGDARVAEHQSRVATASS